MARTADTLRHFALVQATAAALLLAHNGLSAAQSSASGSSLPATAPTISPSQLPSANPPVPVRPAGKTSVTWDGAQIQISAANAGLNSLLREIAGKTGVKITGSAPDERIFGTYGPGKLDDVLSELLDGVPVNVLFVDSTAGARKELVLTARQGGPTPASVIAQDESADPARNSEEPPSTLRRGDFPPPPQQPGPQTAPARGDAAPDAQGGPKTPQQIFEQLQRLRSQSGRQ